MAHLLGSVDLIEVTDLTSGPQRLNLDEVEERTNANLMINGLKIDCLTPMWLQLSLGLLHIH